MPPAMALTAMNKPTLQQINTSELDRVSGGLGRLQLLDRAAQGRWGSQGVVDITQHKFTKQGPGLYGAKGFVTITPIWDGGDPYSKRFVGTVDTIGQHVHGLH